MVSDYERIGGMGHGISAAHQWSGEALADEADDWGRSLSQLFDTTQPVTALDIFVLEPLVEGRVVVRALIASRADRLDPHEIREVEGTTDIIGQVIGAAFKRAHIRLQLRAADLDEDAELPLIDLSAEEE